MTERSTETQSAILDAAIELFSTNGFEVTPMESISTAANVAKGTLYYHFDSKEGIVDAIVERDAVIVEGRLGAIETDTQLNFIDKATAAIGAMTELISASFSKLRKMKFIDIFDKTQMAMVSHCALSFARILEQGNASGQCQLEYPLEYAEIILASSQALLEPRTGPAVARRRIRALIGLSALALGMDLEIVRRIYKPLESYGETLPEVSG
jgi:AcrR family transcriptional regulator